MGQGVGLVRFWKIQGKEEGEIRRRGRQPGRISPATRKGVLLSHYKNQAAGFYVLQLLLLSGPPGLGKTTLAHIIAQQAGYKVFEINARYDYSYLVLSNIHAILVMPDLGQ